MGFVAALPVLSKVALATSAVTAVSGIKQAGAAGKFNQSVAERNAQIAEQEAAQIDKQLEFDLAQFDKEYVKLVGTERVASAKSGVGYEGTALRIARANAEEAQLQKNITTYNSKINKSQKLNEAAFSRIQGSMAAQQARMQKIQIASSFGSSLLTAGQTTKA
jgi:cell division protein FtsL